MESGKPYAARRVPNAADHDRVMARGAGARDHFTGALAVSLLRLAAGTPISLSYATESLHGFGAEGRQRLAAV